MSERQPGGASGVMLKLNAPWSFAYADNLGLILMGVGGSGWLCHAG